MMAEVTDDRLVEIPFRKLSPDAKMGTSIKFVGEPQTVIARDGRWWLVTPPAAETGQP